jgi:hypothetical protein
MPTAAPEDDWITGRFRFRVKAEAPSSLAS